MKKIFLKTILTFVFISNCFAGDKLDYLKRSYTDLADDHPALSVSLAGTTGAVIGIFVPEVGTCTLVALIIISVDVDKFSKSTTAEYEYYFKTEMQKELAQYYANGEMNSLLEKSVQSLMSQNTGLSFEESLNLLASAIN